MEMDRAVMRGRAAPVVLGAIPARAGDRALGRVDGRAMELARAEVDDRGAGNALREVPCRAQAVRGRHGRAGRGQRADLLRRERAVGEARGLDLAVEVPGAEMPGPRAGLADRADAQGARGQPARRRVARGLDRGRAVEAARGQRRLPQEDLAARGVEARRDMVPAARRHRLPRRDARAVGEMDRQRALRVDDEGKARAALSGHEGGDDRLHLAVAQHRLHQRLDRPRRQPRDGVLAIDAHEGAGRDRPQFGGMRAVERRVDVLRLQARALGAGLRADQADELRAIGPRPRQRADAEADRLARGHAPLVAIAQHGGHRQVGHGAALSRSRASGRSRLPSGA